MLYENLRAENVETLLLNAIEILRRIVYGFGMIILYKSPYTQIILNSIFSFTIFHYTLIHKPYQKRLQHIISLYTEMINFMILSVIVAFMYDGLPKYLYEYAEWGLTILLYLSTLIPCVLNIIISIRDIISWLKRRCNRAQEQDIINETQLPTVKIIS
jgi:hypothetical protein